jgi:hypothetical protein
MQLFTAPDEFKPNGKFTVFLAGSIEMGKAEDWQSSMIGSLAHYNINILNPRRKEWDASWVQSRDNLQFYEQVKWELYGLGMSDLILMFLQPGTISPISLLELGLYAASGKMLVCCPDEFGRAGNVEIVCEQYRVAHCTDKSKFFEYSVNKIVQYVRPSL